MLFVEAGWMGRLQEELPGLPHQDYTPFAAPHGDDPRAWAQFNALYTSLSEPGAALAAESQLIAYLAAHGFARLDAAPPMRPADPALRQAHARIRWVSMESHAILKASENRVDWRTRQLAVCGI
jgi:hypothetical protein